MIYGPSTWKATFDNGDSEELLLTPLGDNLYRVEESSLLGEFMYRDVVKAKLLDDGTLRVLSVEARSGLTVQSWILSESIIATAQFHPKRRDGSGWQLGTSVRRFPADPYAPGLRE